jgi:hypothetical protein
VVHLTILVFLEGEKVGALEVVVEEVVSKLRIQQQVPLLLLVLLILLVVPEEAVVTPAQLVYFLRLLLRFSLPPLFQPLPTLPLKSPSLGVEMLLSIMQKIVLLEQTQDGSVPPLLPLPL